MRRRLFLALAVSAGAARAEDAVPLRGRLEPPVLVTRDGRRFTLDGDTESLKVVRDARVAKEDFEAVGTFTAPDRFRIVPSYDRGLFVWRSGKRLEVSYWCDICAIRTYAPGKCVCCQEETEFDPREVH